MASHPSAILAHIAPTRPPQPGTKGAVPRRALIATLLATALAGCGSLPEYRTPKAAEPARSPPLTEPPAGRVVDVGREPEGVAVDPRSGRVAVALRDPPALALLGARDGRLERLVPLPGAPRHLQLARPGGPFLVPAEPADELLRVTPSGTRLPAAKTGAQPHDATAAGGRIFVGDERASTVTVLDGGEPTGRFGVARQPGGLAPVEGGRQIAVVAVRDRVIELYDARTLRRTARANAGVGPTHVVSDGRETLYVADTAGDALLVFTTRPELELTRRIALRSAPYGLALDTRRERLWVTLTGTNRVVKLWTDGPRTVADVASVRQPDTVAVDETTGRAFVTGRVDGVLQLLDPADRRPRTK